MWRNHAYAFYQDSITNGNGNTKFSLAWTHTFHVRLAVLKVTKSVRIPTVCLCDLLCFNPVTCLTVLHYALPMQCVYACVPYDSHNEGQLLTVLHYTVGLCVGCLQRGKREGGLSCLFITEVLFKVSLFSYFFLHFSLFPFIPLYFFFVFFNIVKVLFFYFTNYPFYS